jgi:GT2 family glycosyltransferase
MTVSIIIAVKTWQSNLKECVDNCLRLDYPDFEIIILPDEPFGKILQSDAAMPITVIPTGPVSPGKKRDMAVTRARGDILAFIDDDACPTRNWLKKAVADFNDPEIAAVAGPAVTPAEDSLRQMASGLVFSSLLVSGNFSYRYLPKARRKVNDYPSCNLLVRKSTMQQLGGFNTRFWPGEDTKLCLDITKKLGKAILYDPEVLVYHHRRPLFKPHLAQVASYGLHRGYFVKRYPQTSLKPSYFIPSLFLLGIVAGAVFSSVFIQFKGMYFGGLIIYLILALIFSIHKDLRLMGLVFSGIILSHIVYGIYFIKGLLARRLKEEL